MRLALAALPRSAADPARAGRAEPVTFVAFRRHALLRTDRDPEGCPAGELGRLEALDRRDRTPSRPAVSVFLGDTKAGGERCTDAVVLDRTAAWFARVEGPLVYTPGDNEWTDCWQDRAGRFDPLERLAKLRERFFAHPLSLGGAPMPLVRQSDTDAEHRLYVENARWERGGVLFATVHVPGSDNNRPRDGGDGAVPPGAAAEYPARNRANLAWIAETFAQAEREGRGAVVFALQADLYYRDRCGRGTVEGHLDTREALVDGARRYGRPVLLLHGDSHFHLEDRPAPGAPNLTRLMVPGARDLRAVQVTVDRWPPSLSASRSSAGRTGRPAHGATRVRSRPGSGALPPYCLTILLFDPRGFGQMGEVRASAVWSVGFLFRRRERFPLTRSLADLDGVHAVRVEGQVAGDPDTAGKGFS
jgi:hypothetical protein